VFKYFKLFSLQFVLQLEGESNLSEKIFWNDFFFHIKQTSRKRWKNDQFYRFLLLSSYTFFDTNCLVLEIINLVTSFIFSPLIFNIVSMFLVVTLWSSSLIPRLSVFQPPLCKWKNLRIGTNHYYLVANKNFTIMVLFDAYI